MSTDGNNSSAFGGYSIITFAGMPGSGKSCAAKELAAQLSASGHPARWIDLDEEVQRTAGKSIARIFAEGGESAFRALEKDALWRIIRDFSTPSEASGEISLVLSLGGGTLEDPENLSLIKEHTWCIWLDTPLEIIAERLLAQGDIAQRPLLAGDFSTPPSAPLEMTEKEALGMTLKELYYVRQANYRSAAKEIR